MTISITKSSRIVALAVGAGLVLAVAFGGFAAPAYALTQAEATTIIQVLGLTGSQAAAIQALVTGGGTTGNACTFTRSLTIGSTGDDVTCLQQALIDAGYNIPAITSGAAAHGYFGSQTQAAVAAWQAASGVSPAVGYFGPISQAAWNLGGGTSGGGTTGGSTSGTVKLSGGAGSITDADFIGNLNNEKVGEDQNDAEVAGLNIEADDGSDIMITAVTLDFDQSTGATHDFDKYADNVSIWLDGKKYAEVDASEFTDDKNYERTISLDSGAVIKAGDTGDLVVAITGINNLDSVDAGDTWNVQFKSVRFQDAQGASVTDSSTGDIDNTSDNDTTTDTYERAFTFDTFATAQNVELKARADSDTPEGIITIDDTSDTDGVELLRFTLEAKNGDIRVRDLPITFATSSGNTATALSDILSAAYVDIDGEEYSENVSQASVGSAGATITFQDVDYTISEGDKVTVIVKADINDTEAGSFVDGDALTASFTASNRNTVDAQDETGEDLTSSDRSGTGNGKEVAFYATGIAVSFVSASESVTSGSSANDDAGTFVIKFKVEAVGDTVYVADTATVTTDDTPTTGTTPNGNQFVLYKGSTPTADASGVVTYTTSNGASASSGGYIQLDEGDSTTITLSVSHTNVTGGAGQYYAKLVGIEWNNADSLGASAGNLYTFDLTDYKTEPTTLN